MELQCDLSAKTNEDLLKRMWEQTQDIDHKKEINSHLYKLRESHLRDLYQNEIMSGNYAKDPLNPSHGDSLVGQNFQGLKSKEVRDSVSPTHDLKFHSMTLNHPNTTGWDVQTSSEVSPDGRAYRTETLATTDGVEKINGGVAEFRGRNEQRASASHQGDDKNFVKKASESSNTHLQEHVVIGDENSGRTEMKTSSTTTSSSSHVTSKSSTVEYGGGEPLDGKYIMDNTNRQKQLDHQQHLTQDQYIQQQQQKQELQQNEYEQMQKYQQQQQHVQQEQRKYTEEINRNRQETSTSRNVDTQQTTEKSRRVVDMDKASPEYQQHVQHLMSQPGEIISKTVEYPKPNVKMITTVKRLPDGTIVKNKRYETEELKPTLPESQRQRTTSTTSQHNRNDQQASQQTEENMYNRKQTSHNTTSKRTHDHDVVDNAELVGRVPIPQQQPQSIEPHSMEHYTDEVSNVESKFSSVKKSSRRFSTETTSETIEEFSDQVPSSSPVGIRAKPNKDFSTHGFPSVKPNKPTQEYLGERPNSSVQKQVPDFSTHGFPSVKPNKPTQEYPSQRPSNTDVEFTNQQRTVTQTNTDNTHGYPEVRSNKSTTNDDEVLIVSSESTHTSKFKTNAERTYETEVIIEGDDSDRPQKLTSTRPVTTRPGGGGALIYEQPIAPRKPQTSEDFSTHGFPSVRDVAKPNTTPHQQPKPNRTINQDGNMTIMSSETKKTIKHNAQSEHVTEMEIVGGDHDYHNNAGIRQPDTITYPPTPQPGGFSTHGFPSVRDTAPTADTYPRQSTPVREHSSSPRKPQPSEDFSTHGFPSVRTPTKQVPDFTTPSGGYPNTKDSRAPKLTPTQPRLPTKTVSPTRKPTTTRTTTDSSTRLISKERETDASHRAFAASLRCSSPAPDSIDHHQRMTPRSSVSSNRTFRRDGREGSHDSNMSRISSGTVTRASPSKSVGKTSVTKQTVVKTRNVTNKGSNETIDLTPQRHTKSPSPSNKTQTTTTTTIRTTTTTPANRKSPGGVGIHTSVVPKADNQIFKPAAKNTYPIVTSTINEPLTIKKSQISANDAANSFGKAVVEEPCLKKNYYKLGPSDKATKTTDKYHVDEKSPNSPAPSNHHLHRTYPNETSPQRDYFEDINREEPINNQSSSIIETKHRNRSPTTGPQCPNNNIGPNRSIYQPISKERSFERRTVVRKNTIENDDWQDDNIQTEKPHPIRAGSPEPKAYPPTNGMLKQSECTEETLIEDKTPLDINDYPGRRPIANNKRPDIKNKTESITVKSERRTKNYEAENENDLTVEMVTKNPEVMGPIGKKPLDSINKGPKESKPREPLNRKPNEKQPTETVTKTTGDKKPAGKMPISPTRRTVDINTSRTSTVSTSVRTLRNNIERITAENIHHKQPTIATNDNEINRAKPYNQSPTSKPIELNRHVTVTKKTLRQEHPSNEQAFGELSDESSYETDDRKPKTKALHVAEFSPTRKTVDNRTTKITTVEQTRKIDCQPDEPEQTEPTTKSPIKERNPSGKRPSVSNVFVRDERSPARTTTTTSVATTTTKMHSDNVSPTRKSKPTKDRLSEPTKKQPTHHNQTENSEDEYVPIEPKPSETPRATKSARSGSQTKSIHESNMKSDLISTIKTNDESYESRPRNKGPFKPSAPEYSDDNEEIIRKPTTENIAIIETQSGKPGYPTDGNRIKPEDNKPSNTENRPNEPSRETPFENKNNMYPKKPSNLTETEDQTTNYITTKVKTVHGDQPQPKNFRTTDETYRVEELFKATEKTKVAKNAIEQFITFEKPLRDKTPINELEYLKAATKQPVEPRKKDDRETSKHNTVEGRKEIYEKTENIERKEHKSSKVSGEEALPKTSDGPKLMQPRTTDSSDDEEYTQEAYDRTTTTINGKDIRNEIATNAVNTTITTTMIAEDTEDGEESRKPLNEPNKRLPKTDETQRIEDLFDTTIKTKYNKNYNEEFIAKESRRHKETPDGAFISKAPEPRSEPSSPTFKKKGVNPRETFEDRCRQILGMDDYGDTQGNYKKKPDDRTDDKQEVTVTTAEFEVRIEDCEDDEPNYLNNIKEAIKKPQRQMPSNTNDRPNKRSQIDIKDEDFEVVQCKRKETVAPFEGDSPEKEINTKSTRKSNKKISADECITTTKTVLKPIKKTSLTTKNTLETVETGNVESSTSESETPDKDTDEESQADTVVSEREMKYMKEEEKYFSSVENKGKKQPLKSFETPTDQRRPSKHSSPYTSPTRRPSESIAGGRVSPSKQKPTSSRSAPAVSKSKTHKPDAPATKEVNDIKPTTKSPEQPEKRQKEKPTSPTRKTRQELLQKNEIPATPDKIYHKPGMESPTSNIKDRLRSATSKNKPSDTESDSSPSLSPTRLTERRRSSNISVHTEIIIDHAAPKSPKAGEKTPEKPKPQQSKKSTTSEAGISLTSTKPFRRLPVTERKESAPVPSVTRKDKNAKVARSTSEQATKVTSKSTKKTEVDSLATIPTTPKGERRPNKCFTTKTINLTASDKLINKQEIENIVIDIQHAKSSREPSPDKIVPTPVPVHLDTGKPRYPDVVQEPEDEPRKKPVITNIPIFEEESNEFVNCHITEIKTDKTSKLVDLDEDDILDNPTIEAPKSLEYPSIDKPDDECLLSVHEKVSKFTHTAEEIKKPKASSPFSREFDKTPKVPENDDCLLTVDEKVNKFTKSAEEVTKQITPVRDIELPKYIDLDEEMRQDDCTLTVSQKVNKFLSTAEKLAPTAPQTAPELVAKIERTISKQSEPEYPEDVSDDSDLTPFSQNHTIEIEKRRQKDILSRPSVFENNTTTKCADYEKVEENDITKMKQTAVDVPEDEEFIPHTKDHTTKIELKRQKNILSRPSIYEKNTTERPQSPTKRTPMGSPKLQQTIVSKTKTEQTIKNVTSQNNERIEIEKERKPSTPTRKTDNRNSPIKLESSRVAETKSRFEAPDNRKVSPKSVLAPKEYKVPSTLRQENQSPRMSVRKPSPEPHSRYSASKLSKQREIDISENEHLESETEITSKTRRRSSSKTKDYLETVQTEIERFSPDEKEPEHKILSRENFKNQTISLSPTRKDSTIKSTNKVTKVIERTTQHNSPSDSSDIEIIETIIECPTPNKTPFSPKTTTPFGRTRLMNTDTVTARRNMFENGDIPKDQKPNGSSNSPSPVGRRPSYMDHTVSSLEHIRRDSLEVNKQNYSRKSSVESENNYERRPNVSVKFDVPHKPQRTSSISEDIDVENIFDIEVLERMLETVTSYEIRRRIRAQIRLVKKNLLNTEMVDKKRTETSKTTKSTSSTHKSSTHTSNVHHEETDKFHEELKTKRPSYDGKNNESSMTTRITYAKIPNERSESPNKHSSMTSPHERSHSPERKTTQEVMKEIRRTSGSSMSAHKEYMSSEHTSERYESRQRSPERNFSPEPTKSHTRDGRKSPSKSPDSGKPLYQRTTSPQAPRTPKKRDDLYTISKVTTLKSTRTNSPERKTNKPSSTTNRDENTPIWADRKNLLKSPSSSGPSKVPASPSTRATTATKTTTSKSMMTSQRQNQNRNIEEDEITSSYGIGPTDENGLPLFGIKALKKKKTSQPCEANEEVTGYVIEEKYYSDSKTKPKVERKEYIYSTNAEDLEEMKKTVEKSRKTSKDDVDIIRKFEKIEKDYVYESPDAILADEEEAFSTSSSKYVHRGSVKELSEKFIRKESTQSTTDKSGYPKAGLILRTSRGSSAEPSGDNYETTTEKYTNTTKSSNTAQGHRSSEDENNVQLRQNQSRRLFTEIDTSEGEECHMSTRSSTKSTRSFLNSSDETKVVTSVDDVLERMRNADNVVEDGDTAEDREARSLLNKFLGASIIMKGVESVIPTTKQIKTTTITKTSYADGDDDYSDLLKNKAVTSTRLTKTAKSGSSSTPVTRTTCDIEEIWDEELLKELLEQATTYEERRKIRARLRDLMAEREEKKNSKSSGELSEHAPEADESSTSEYEEIIEEVTVSDYSDAEGDLGEDEEKVNSSQKSSTSDVKKLNENKEKDKEVKGSKIQPKLKESVQSNQEEKVKAASSSAPPESETEAKPNRGADKTDSKAVNDKKGESLVPLLQGILQKSLPKVVSKSLFATEKTQTDTELKREEKSNTQNTQNTYKACASSSSNNSDSNISNSIVNNNKNKKNNSQNNQGSQDSLNPTQSTKNTNETPQTDTNIETKSSDSMTRDVTMAKNATAATSGTISSASKQKQLDRLSVPQKEDSGTESGEDLRLIAAGLRDSLHLQSDTNLIAEVTTALTRLEQSLKEGKDIPVDGSKRQALLALVARLQTGLTTTDASVNPCSETAHFDETSSPEAEAQRSNRQRFARRRNRNSRHTVGVSREELEDARRYMEDMLLMENISNCTTPENGNLSQPQWFPIEKNPSTGALLATNNLSSTVYSPNQFVPAQFNSNGENKQVTLREKSDQKGQRPLSGNFSVSFQSSNGALANTHGGDADATADMQSNENTSPDSNFKSNRFTNKKQLMKRANTIDIPKTKKYNPDFDTDSEPEEKQPQLGLKRTLQVNVKHKVRNVIPPFVPKTENDHKFLAFINKQSDKPGLGWAGTRSVSNWTNKFGNLKHTFEVGAAAQATAGKPPQAPGHVSHNAAKNYRQKQVATTHDHQQPQQQPYLQYPQQQQQRGQQEAHERQRRLERERIERDRLERQRLERERQERDRLEREYYEREVMERERLAAAQHAAMPSMTVPQPAPVNKFQHAPQSVFRPIDSNDSRRQNIFKPIPQLPQKANTWQPPSINATNKSSLSAPIEQMTPASPQYLTANQSVNYSKSPTSNSSSPIGLPWVAKPSVDNSDFKKIANTFEERSQNDNRQYSSAQNLQRHHSLRSQKVNQQQQMDDYKKRPSLPNTADPYMAAFCPYGTHHQQPSQIYASATDIYAQPPPPPPPTNYSFIYADLPRTSNYKSYPCLPSAVETSIAAEYARKRESSLTDPNAVPLVLTNSNPTYEPPSAPPAVQDYYNGAPRSVKQFDYVSPMDSAPASPSMFTLPQTDYASDDLDSDNLMEYRAETRVMGKPKGQTAVTIRDRRTAHASDDEVFGKNSRSAQNLLHTMRNIGDSRNGMRASKKEPVQKTESPKACLSPDGRAYHAPIVEPIFPDVTKFEPNRTPEYIEDPIINQIVSKPQKTRPKTPPIPKEQVNRNLQLQRHSEENLRKQQQEISVERQNYASVNEVQKMQQNQQQQQRQTQYLSNSVSNTSSTNSVPPVNEAQAAGYVITYPTVEMNQNGFSEQPPLTTLPLQRNRNLSENSTASSSVSHNLPSPGTNWTANPIHDVNEITSPPKKPQKSLESRKLSQTAYKSQENLNARKMNYSSVQDMPQPQAQPKLATATQQAVKAPVQSPPMLPPSIYQPQQHTEPGKQPQFRIRSSVQSDRQPQPKEPTIQITRTAQPPQPQPKPQAKTAAKLVTHSSQKLSTSSESQSFDQTFQPRTQPKVLLRQRTVEVEITPLQMQNRAFSQQSLVASKQRKFEQQQQQGEAERILENRRKSLGNVYITESKTVLKQEYKSSAPPDTPDIVKSSLPKDDTPILKKYGPPQRHHYMPNSYQNPVSQSTQKQKQQATSTTEKTETKEKDGAVVTTTTKVTTRTITGGESSATKPVSAFAKFRQLDKQSSQQSPKSPSTPNTPGGKASPSGSARIFQFTDPALNARAATAKEQLLQWCQSKTQEYENIKITNFSGCWSDGLAFCALIHHFLPDAFDYSKLTAKNRRHNFELAFTVADEKAGIAPLLDVEDMVEMQRPDWKCVFIYVQSIYRRFRNCQ